MFYIGIDRGKRRDHTAIAIVERYNNQLLVRHLERLPLGTPYTAVITRVVEIVRALGRCVIIVDGTGVGEPVVDALRRAGLGCEITSVTITSGDRKVLTGTRGSVPKHHLMSRLQMAIEQKELRVAKSLEDSGALVKELLQVRAREGLTIGKPRIGADGAGEHDDLVIAVALACWRARRRENSFGEALLPSTTNHTTQTTKPCTAGGLAAGAFTQKRRTTKCRTKPPLSDPSHPPADIITAACATQPFFSSPS